jgi:hypothetical protein
MPSATDCAARDPPRFQTCSQPSRHNPGLGIINDAYAELGITATRWRPIFSMRARGSTSCKTTSDIDRSSRRLSMHGSRTGAEIGRSVGSNVFPRKGDTATRVGGRQPTHSRAFVIGRFGVTAAVAFVPRRSKSVGAGHAERLHDQ